MEETPGRLEYEVALYKEAPARINNNTNSELPVDQAVPIGTKLQLRARINPHSGKLNLHYVIPIQLIPFLVINCFIIFKGFFWLYLLCLLIWD